MLSIKNKAFLAPMAAFSDIAFRVQCRKYGAGMVFSEMVNATALCRNNKSTLELARTCQEEKPVAVQLFGSRTDQIAEAAKLIEKQVDAIDFNFGCPDAQIVRQGAGAALLKRPAKIKEIITALSSSVSVPISGKIRIVGGTGAGNGTGKSTGTARTANTVKIAKMIEAGGAWAVTVHGRTLGQGYSGKASWDAIKAVKDAVSIKVIGNGDVADGRSAQAMMDQTGCDYVMVGRAAMNDPSIFKRINHYLKTGEELPAPTKEEKIKMLCEYLGLAKKYKVARFQDIKRHSHSFLTGFHGASELRFTINTSPDIDDLLEKIRA